MSLVEQEQRIAMLEAQVELMRTTLREAGIRKCKHCGKVGPILDYKGRLSWVWFCDSHSQCTWEQQATEWDKFWYKTFGF